MLANFGVRGSIWPEYHHRERGIRQAWMAAYCAVMGLLLSSPPAIAAGRVFYDGFEDGTTNLWSPESGRDRCPVVTSSVDGIKGPYAGGYMVRCNWTSSTFEELMLTSLPNTTKEIFYRFHHRIDNDVDRSPGSGAKLLRIYNWTGDPVTGLDVCDVVGGTDTPGLNNTWVFSGNNNRYYGGKAGDTSANSSEWNTTEYYFNRSNGSLKIWHDDVLVVEQTGTYAAWAIPLYIVSNWHDPHDDSNHVYFDDIEVFTEVGNTATGSMADGTVSVDSAPPASPSAVRVE